MADLSLLYGLGVTRSGSTWLHAALRAHPQVHLRAVKEAHWFDSLEYARMDKHLDNLRAKRTHIAARDPSDERVTALSGLIAALENGATHQEYLGFLQAEAPEGTRVLGDITPAYATLPEMRLRQMQTVGLPARFLIVLRDPFARLVSHIQFIAARKLRKPSERLAEATRTLRQFLAGRHDGLALRSDYAAMFARLDAAIAPANLLVLFFERLFQPETLHRLTDWLGLDRVGTDMPSQTNTSPSLPLDDGLLAQAHTRLAPQYAFARARFGAELPADWRAPQWQEV
ncbi:MAG: sulfotransferase [Rhodobacteraceae bacterium]|nr:sulfotransferase [Paracoccaceae bacterium]